MGQPRRWRIRSAPVLASISWLTPGLLLALLACAGGPPAVDRLLLSPEDFPGIPVTQTGYDVLEATGSGQPAGRVELSGPGFTLDQRLVIYDSVEQAMSTLAGIKRDQIPQGVVPHDEGGSFQDASGVLSETRGDTSVSTLFFVEGRALVRISVSGPDSRELLPVYAEKARARASRR